MLNLSVLYLLFTFIFALISFCVSYFTARKIATALIPSILFLWLFQIFDIYLNHSNLQLGLIDLVSKLHLTNAKNEMQIATFFSGLLIVIEVVCIFLAIYGIFSRFITYVPPVMLTTREKYGVLSRSILWKLLFFISLDLSCIYLLTVMNHLMQLPEGFLSSFFHLGFGVSL